MSLARGILDHTHHLRVQVNHLVLRHLNIERRRITSVSVERLGVQLDGELQTDERLGQQEKFDTSDQLTGSDELSGRGP